MNFVGIKLHAPSKEIINPETTCCSPYPNKEIETDAEIPSNNWAEIAREFREEKILGKNFERKNIEKTAENHKNNINPIATKFLSAMKTEWINNKAQPNKRSVLLNSNFVKLDIVLEIEIEVKVKRNMKKYIGGETKKYPE